MFKKLRLYAKFFWFCWTSRSILNDLDAFLSLPEDEGKRYKLEIRNIRNKIKNRARQKGRDRPTKSQYLRLMLYETFNDQMDEEFVDSLRFPFVLLAVWAITKENPSVDDLVEDEAEGNKE